ncbi:MAG: helix-turn-helix domain-containing protein, partial [Alphaproteobacteria bacterium]
APQPAVPSPLIIPAAPHAVSAARVKKKAPAQQVGGEDKAQATNNQPLLETLIAEHGIGHAIATFRQNAGVSLAEISDDLKISQSHLINLESQQFDRLPNRAYAVGFVRSIARYLKLDDGYLVDKFKAHWDMPEEIQPPEFLQPINQWNISGFWLVAATLIALVGGYYGWKTLTQSEFTIPQPALIADKAPVNENTVNKNIADDPIMPAPAARPAPEAIMPEPIMPEPVMPEILINEESQSAPAAAIIQEIIVGDTTTDQPPQQAPAPDLAPELIAQEIPEPDIAQPISSVNIIQLKAIRSSWLQLETVAGDIIFEGIIAQNDMIDIDGQHRISFSDGEALALIYRNENKGLLFDYMGRSAYAMLFDPASFADQP